MEGLRGSIWPTLFKPVRNLLGGPNAVCTGTGGLGNGDDGREILGTKNGGVREISEQEDR